MELSVKVEPNVKVEREKIEAEKEKLARQQEELRRQQQQLEISRQVQYIVYTQISHLKTHVLWDLNF